MHTCDELCRAVTAVAFVEFPAAIGLGGLAEIGELEELSGLHMRGAERAVCDEDVIWFDVQVYEVQHVKSFEHGSHLRFGRCHNDEAF